MLKPHSYISLLIEDLKEIEQMMMKLIDSSTLRHTLNQENPWLRRSKGARGLSPIDLEWAPLDERASELQRNLEFHFDSFYKNFIALFPDTTSAKRKQIEENCNVIRSWIRSKRHLRMPISREDAKTSFLQDFKFLTEHIMDLEQMRGPEVVLIPDTNAFIICSDFEKYVHVVNTEDICVIFTTTIISELDNLKMNRSNEEFRKKVESKIRILKGWRNQGDVLKGITIHKTIKIRMFAIEPGFREAPEWLDKNNNDDRIIATALEIQREYPCSKIIIVSNDINLQNKGELARIPCIEPIRG